MTPPIPVGVLASARVAAGASLEYHDEVTASTDWASSFTINVPIGTAHTARTVIITLGSRSAVRTLTTATIGGVTATVHKYSGDWWEHALILSAAVPTGTTADVYVQFNDWMRSPCVFSYSIASAITEVSTGLVGGTTSSVGSLSTSDGGFAVAIRSCVSSSYGPWSGVTEDELATFNGYRYTSASAATDGTGLTISCASTDGSSLAAATFSLG